MCDFMRAILGFGVLLLPLVAETPVAEALREDAPWWRLAVLDRRAMLERAEGK